jgi:hypothetical protein
MTEFESEMLSESRKQTVILAEIVNNLKAIYERDIRIAKKRPKTNDAALENSNNSELSPLQKDTVLYVKFTLTISYYPDFSKDYIKLNDSPSPRLGRAYSVCFPAMFSRRWLLPAALLLFLRSQDAL